MEVLERMWRLCLKIPLCHWKSRPSSNISGFSIREKLWGRKKDLGRQGFGKYLSFGEIQVHSYLVSPEPCQVVMVGKFSFQLP